MERMSELLESRPGSQEIILAICESLSNAFSSEKMPKDDLYQETFIFCMDGLARYRDESGHLEHFLRVHARNRLLNLIRNTRRRSIVSETVDIEVLADTLSYDEPAVAEEEDLLGKIQRDLNPREMKLLSKMIDKCPNLSAKKVENVREKVRKALFR